MAGRSAGRLRTHPFGLMAAIAIVVLAVGPGRSAMAADAWVYRTAESDTGEMAHVAAYALSTNRSVQFEVGCGTSSASWIAVAVNDPDTMARGLAEDSSIPVIFTFVEPSSSGLGFLDHRDRIAVAGMPQSPPGGSFSVLVTGSDVRDLARRLAGEYGYVEVRQGGTTATFSLVGAPSAIRQAMEGCSASSP